MPNNKKKVERIRHIFQQTRVGNRQQWETINQKGYDFAHDQQLSVTEKKTLEDQGMPTFTINRIIPIVEMLNFYATAQTPRWQAVGAEGSDIDVAAVFADMADYIWYLSNGSSLYSNAVNDAITKSIGYMMVTVNKDLDNGMGEVILTQPEPFDIFVDPKSRDILFRDASYIQVRKVLPKEHLKQLYPEHANRIQRIKGQTESEIGFSEKPLDDDQLAFGYKDVQNTFGTKEGDVDTLIEYIEHYEKKKVPFVNVFYNVPPTPEEMEQINQQVQVQMQEMAAEMEVKLAEQQAEMEKAVQAGEMLPERYELEMEKAQKMMQQQLQAAQQEMMSDLQTEHTKVENMVLRKKDFQTLKETEEFGKYIVDVVEFYENRVMQICIVGDKLIYEYELPSTDYPIVPIHYKWTGTPYPISAVAPLVGKQMELNKAHQLMVHNASLGSSLRWMYFKGSIDEDYWEKYATAPGALLPVNQGFEVPSAVPPAQLSNAFFGIVQEGKQDMEYLAGIYSSMQGDTQSQHETFRGMLALDEYGTRRIKQWLKASVEPALQQLGEIVKQYTQTVYTANKRFRIVQPSAIQEGREVEINIPIYNDMGEAIGKSMEYGAAKFDVRIVTGSTLPVNRWAYLAELKELLNLGVVDDIAVLAETDIRNKGNIVKRKSMLSQLQGQLGQMEESLKDKEGTIETLERQLVQAGIKGKIMQAEVEINKKQTDQEGVTHKELLQTQAEQKLLRGKMKQQQEAVDKEARLELKDLQREIGSIKKDLQNKEKE